MGSEMDDMMSFFDSDDDEIPMTFPTWTGISVLPRMVRQNATILMSPHNECLYM